MSPLEQSLIAFTLAAALLTVTPGLDTALVLRTAAAEGPRRAFFAGLGICLGCLVWGLIVALGLGILLETSVLAYTILRWVGAAYLLYLGIQLILSRRVDFGADGATTAARAEPDWFGAACSPTCKPQRSHLYVSSCAIRSGGRQRAAHHRSDGGDPRGARPALVLALIGATRPIAAALRKPR